MYAIRSYYVSSGAADIFGATGGVMEAAIRTVYEVITERELPFENLHVKPVMGLEGIKEAELLIERAATEWSMLEGKTLKVAVASGLSNAKWLMQQVKEGNSPYHFIEIMCCPGGCISGGGQPRPTTDIVRQKRMEAVITSYSIHYTKLYECDQHVMTTPCCFKKRTNIHN